MSDQPTRTVLTITWPDGTPGEDVRRLSRGLAERVSMKLGDAVVRVQTFGTVDDGSVRDDSSPLAPAVAIIEAAGFKIVSNAAPAPSVGDDAETAMTGIRAALDAHEREPALFCRASGEMADAECNSCRRAGRCLGVESAQADTSEAGEGEVRT